MFSREQIRERAAKAEQERMARMEEENKKKQTMPHIVNLHSDMLFSNTVFYYFHEGKTRVCQPHAQPKPTSDDVGK